MHINLTNIFVFVYPFIYLNGQPLKDLVINMYLSFNLKVSKKYFLFKELKNLRKFFIL